MAGHIVRRAFIFLFLLFLLAFTFRSSHNLAIVVNKSNPIEDISMKELIKIFKAEKQYWDAEKIALLMREQGSWERELVLKKIYGMREEELKKFWLGKMFRGEITSFPAVFGSQSMIKRLVANLKGAVSFIDSQNIDSTVKVIRIDGKLPGEAGYLLSE